MVCEQGKNSWKMKEQIPFEMKEIKDVAPDHATIFYNNGFWTLRGNDTHNYPIVLIYFFKLFNN